MATIWFLLNLQTVKRQVVRFLSTEENYRLVANELVPPTWTRVDFDCDTNSDLCLDLGRSTDPYIQDTTGRILKSGKVVKINDPAPDSLMRLDGIKVNGANGDAVNWLIQRAKRGRVIIP